MTQHTLNRAFVFAALMVLLGGSALAAPALSEPRIGADSMFYGVKLAVSDGLANLRFSDESKAMYYAEEAEERLRELAFVNDSELSSRVVAEYEERVEKAAALAVRAELSGEEGAVERVRERVRSSTDRLEEVLMLTAETARGGLKTAINATKGGVVIVDDVTEDVLSRSAALGERVRAGL